MNILFRGALMLSLLTVAFGALSTAPSRSARAEGPLELPELKLPSHARPGVTGLQAVRALTVLAKSTPEELKANSERIRGWGLSGYPKVAPAIVVVHIGNGHGTGFFISNDGRALTNCHVTAYAPVDPKTGVQTAKLFLGHLEGRLMVLDKPAIDAAVYKRDEGKDLALLKVTQLPQGIDELPVIPSATESAAPGSDCVAVGHPAGGMLWTVRSGEVSALGTWPRDVTEILLGGWTLKGQDREDLASALANAPKRRIIISTCVGGPGDSGGPLLDKGGALVGVTFGGPGATELARLAYHVHLDEVKAFVKDRPKKPPIFVPDPWQLPAILNALADRDGDRIPDTLVFAIAPEAPPVGFLMDLDQDSDRRFDPAKLSNPAERKNWEFEHGFHRVPQFRTFYDTDSDGTVDLILTDTDGDKTANLVLKLEDDTWKRVPADHQRMFDPALFVDQNLRRRFVEVHTGKGKPPKKP